MMDGDAADRLQLRYGHLDGADLLGALKVDFPDRMAVISSFGSESAVLLELVARVDRTLPVIFLDTDELFTETLDYQRALTLFLGLTDVRVVKPRAEDVKAAENLWLDDPDQCCRLRKVLPLERAIAGFTVLVDGRKRFHGDARSRIATVAQSPDGLIKASPLARFTRDDIEAAFIRHGLPRHPLLDQGYRSIGCWPCSRPTSADEPARAGRWAGMEKTECGIHTTSYEI